MVIIPCGKYLGLEPGICWLKRCFGECVKFTAQIRCRINMGYGIKIHEKATKLGDKDLFAYCGKRDCFTYYPILTLPML